MDVRANGQPEAMLLMSLYKPLLVMAALWVWAWLVGWINQDMKQYFEERRFQINVAQLGVGGLVFILWLAMPWFWAGFVLVGFVTIPPAVAYVGFRNKRVPYAQRLRTPRVIWQAFRARKAAKSRQTIGTEVRFLDVEETPLDMPKAGSAWAAAHDLFSSLVTFALPRGAEGIEAAVDPQQGRIYVRIDGVRYPWPGLDGSKPVVALIDYLKYRAGMDLADRRRRLTGVVFFSLDDSEPQRLVVTTSGSTRGFGMVVEINPHLQGARDVKSLGLSKAQRRQIEEVLGTPNHLVLVSCPPGQGQSSTLYALLGLHDPYTQAVTALEQQPLRELEGVDRRPLSEYLNEDERFQQVEAALIDGADVLLLDRIEGHRCAHLIAKAASETRIYVGMDGQDTFGVLRYWMELVGDRRLAGGCLGAIVCGRLVRKLCPACRLPYRPDPEVLRKLNLPVDRVGLLYKQSGQRLRRGRAFPCPQCLGIGYRGREGVFELMVFDDEARRIAAHEPLSTLRAYMRKKKMLWLQEAALAKAVDGVTSIREITRVFSRIDRSLPGQSSPGASQSWPSPGSTGHPGNTGSRF